MDSLQLTRLCRRDRCALSKCFIGVFPKDKLPSDLPRPACLIANTDTSRSSGQHWIAIFINKEGYGDFFCSYGVPPCRLFTRFMDKHSISWNFNRKCIQSHVSTTCGQYCVFFLFCRVEGLSMSKFLKLFTTNQAENDDLVTAFINGKFKLSTKVIDNTFIQ
jgi:hypothetical protein